MSGDWNEWRNHVLAEMKRMADAQNAQGLQIASLLKFKTETKASGRTAAVIISSIFGLASLLITVYVNHLGVR